MSKLIIVCGLPGSGKTTLAKELAKKLNIFCLHKDSIKENLYELLELKTLDDSKMIGKKSIQLLLSLAKEHVLSGVDIILEAPFNYEKDIQTFHEWKNKYNLDIYCIITYIDSETRKDRFTNRVRHQCHHDEERILIQKNILEEYEYKNMPGKKIDITTNIPTEELVDYIIKQIQF